MRGVWQLVTYPLAEVQQAIPAVKIHINSYAVDSLNELARRSVDTKKRCDELGGREYEAVAEALGVKDDDAPASDFHFEKPIPDFVGQFDSKVFETCHNDVERVRMG